MIPMLTGLIIGLPAGIIITLLVIIYSSPAIMFKENKSKHDFETTMAVAAKETDEIIDPLFD